MLQHVREYDVIKRPVLLDKFGGKNPQMNVQPARGGTLHPLGVRLDSHDGGGCLLANDFGDDPGPATHIQNTGLRRDEAGQLHAGVVRVQ